MLDVAAGNEPVELYNGNAKLSVRNWNQDSGSTQLSSAGIDMGGIATGAFDIQLSGNTIMTLGSGAIAQGLSLNMSGSATLYQGSASTLSVSSNFTMKEQAKVLIIFNATIQAARLHLGNEASINGSARGYGNCEGPGSAINSHSKNSFRLGGSHGGLGTYESVEEFVELEGKMLANDDVFWPQLPGSGGCGLSGRADGAGHGGAYLHLQVLEESEIWGEIDLSGGHADESSSNHGYVIFIDSFLTLFL